MHNLPIWQRRKCEVQQRSKRDGWHYQNYRKPSRLMRQTRRNKNDPMLRRKPKSKLTIMHVSLRSSRIQSSRFLTTHFLPTNTRTSLSSLLVHLNLTQLGLFWPLKGVLKFTSIHTRTSSCKTHISRVCSRLDSSIHLMGKMMLGTLVVEHSTPD